MVHIYTDGSCLGNPGPGGFCAIIKAPSGTTIVKGGDTHTTNNRMELSAVIAGLAWLTKNLPKEKEVHIYSDSSLVIQTMRQGWKRKKNLDLWEKLDRLISYIESPELGSRGPQAEATKGRGASVERSETELRGGNVVSPRLNWHWVRGHAGHPENTQADKVAVKEAVKRQKTKQA